MTKGLHWLLSYFPTLRMERAQEIRTYDEVETVTLPPWSEGLIDYLELFKMGKLGSWKEGSLLCGFGEINLALYQFAALISLKM